MNGFKAIRLISGLLLFFFCASGYAQTGLSDSNTIQSDIQTLFSQWRTEDSQSPANRLNFHRYLVRTAKTSKALEGQAYQPLYVLPCGVWIMGFSDASDGSLSVLVDVTHLPDGSGARKFILNSDGSTRAIEELKR